MEKESEKDVSRRHEGGKAGRPQGHESWESGRQRGGGGGRPAVVTAEAHRRRWPGLCLRRASLVLSSRGRGMTIPGAPPQPPFQGFVFRAQTHPSSSSSSRTGQSEHPIHLAAGTGVRMGL